MEATDGLVLVGQLLVPLLCLSPVGGRYLAGEGGSMHWAVASHPVMVVPGCFQLEVAGEVGHLMLPWEVVALMSQHLVSVQPMALP